MSGPVITGGAFRAFAAARSRRSWLATWPVMSVYRMATRIMALMASLASRCGLAGSTATAVLASQRENASCSTSFRWIATCIVTAASSSPRYGPGRQGARSSWTSSKHGLEDPSAADPVPLDTVRVLSHSGQKTRHRRSKSNRTDARSSRSLRMVVLGAGARYDSLVQSAGLTAEKALLFEYAYRGAGPG